MNMFEPFNSMRVVIYAFIVSDKAVRLNSTLLKNCSLLSRAWINKSTLLLTKYNSDLFLLLSWINTCNSFSIYSEVFVDESRCWDRL